MEIPAETENEGFVVSYQFGEQADDEEDREDPQ